MYYLLSELGLRLGLDALTFGLVFIMAGIGSRLLRITLDSLLLAILFFPILAFTSVLANYLGLSIGVTEQFLVPQGEIGLIRYISPRDFIVVMLVTFSGMLVGLAGILGMYKAWGHAG